MRSEWRELPLGSVVRLQRGHDLTASNRTAGQYPVMGSAGQNGTHTEFKAPGPGVVVGRSGASIGRVHYTESSYWPHNTCLYVTDFLGNDPKFIYYLLQTLPLAQYNSGSVQPSLNRNYAYSIDTVIPEPEEQAAISSLLGSLEAKIANNRALAADLEAMARAIFKSWFVDFDPVKAKIEGRTPSGMDADTAALFPDALVESELGLIPEGWEASSIGEVAENVKAGVKADAIDPDEPYVALEHFEKACLSLFANATGQEATSNKTRFQAGDLLFGKLRPYFHKVSIAPFDGVCSTDVLAIRPKFEYYAAYTYCAFSNKAVIDYVTNLSGGTRMPRTNWKQLASFPAAIPPDSVADAFNKLAAPMLQFVADVGAENRKLSELRDTLLPRLISGKIRLPEAAKAVETA